MKDITSHAQYAVLMQSPARQPATCPDDDIVSPAAQEHDHLLSGKAFFATFADVQSLLAALEGGFDPASALIVEPDVGQEHGSRIIEQREGLASQIENVLSRQSGEKHAVSPLSVLLAAAHGNRMAKVVQPINCFVVGVVDSFVMILLSQSSDSTRGMAHPCSFGKSLSCGSLPLVWAKFRY